MPTTESANSKKREKLPSAPLMHSAKHRILYWWELAYMQNNNPLKQQFLIEAEAALPLLEESNNQLDAIFDAMLHQRAKLRANQQLAEWGS